MRLLIPCLSLAVLGCAPPPMIGGDDDTSTSGPDGSEGMEVTSADSTGTGSQSTCELDPALLDRMAEGGACGYPGPGPSGYGTEVGQRLANNTDEQLSTCDGEPVELADYLCSGEDGPCNRVLLVNIGAGWCLPCQAETLEFPELYEEFHDQGLEIVQVLYQDWVASAPTGAFCNDWASGNWSGGGGQGVALDFPVIMDQAFDWGSIYLQDPAAATPINMLIDANGNIRWKLEAQQAPLEVLRAQIELILEDPYAPPS